MPPRNVLQNTMEEWMVDEIDNRNVKSLESKIREGGEITAGTQKGCPCPWCGRTNARSLQTVRIKHGAMSAIEKPCEYCGRIILYLARFAEVNEGSTVVLQAKACQSNLKGLV